jgi:hypothetical protein
MGKLADPSALIGVLNSSHDIEYPILSVEYLETGSWRFSLILWNDTGENSEHTEESGAYAECTGLPDVLSPPPAYPSHSLTRARDEKSRTELRLSTGKSVQTCAKIYTCIRLVSLRNE